MRRAEVLSWLSRGTRRLRRGSAAASERAGADRISTTTRPLWFLCSAGVPAAGFPVTELFFRNRAWARFSLRG